MAEIRDEEGNVIGHICSKEEIYPINQITEDESLENDFKRLSLGKMLKIIFKRIFRIN
jgi:hypothetical protein